MSSPRETAISHLKVAYAASAITRLAPEMTIRSLAKEIDVDEEAALAIAKDLEAEGLIEFRSGSDGEQVIVAKAAITQASNELNCDEAPEKWSSYVWMIYIMIGIFVLTGLIAATKDLISYFSGGAE